MREFISQYTVSSLPVSRGGLRSVRLGSLKTFSNRRVSVSVVKGDAMRARYQVGYQGTRRRHTIGKQSPARKGIIALRITDPNLRIVHHADRWEIRR